ncbi:Anthranilate synthase component II [Serratia fonticola]|uniref:Anthranilate synthase component II n=1 Tax=Serratia fonticola TaxID=47917 RepID=A0A4U9UJB8_SERFO|nr:Anthranilate synthase component II [Serratia fonticola]
MQPILEKLYRSESMSQEESQQLFSAIVRGELEPSQLAAALISMKIRGEHPEEIAGAAKALLADALPFPRPDYAFADIVGTGGDGTNSINISTASAFVAAACGVKVAKHGNRSVSSRSGSSDLLAAFGSAWICLRKNLARHWMNWACVSCLHRSITPVFAMRCRYANS